MQTLWAGVALTCVNWQSLAIQCAGSLFFCLDLLRNHWGMFHAAWEAYDSRLLIVRQYLISTPLPTYNGAFLTMPRKLHFCLHPSLGLFVLMLALLKSYETMKRVLPFKFEPCANPGPSCAEFPFSPHLSYFGAKQFLAQKCGIRKNHIITIRTILWAHTQDIFDDLLTWFLLFWSIFSKVVHWSHTLVSKIKKFTVLGHEIFQILSKEQFCASFVSSWGVHTYDGLGQWYTSHTQIHDTTFWYMTVVKLAF